MNIFDGYLLLIEDEPSIQLNNVKILRRRGYSVKQASTLAEARAIMSDSPPKAIILDLHLPDGNGLELLKEIRENSSIPVLILTAMSTRDDIVLGFETGSDDYLTKPYDLSVFLMRVEALLRRATIVPEVIELGSITLRPTSATATLDGEDMLLTQKEYSILQLFVQNPDKIMSADYIYEKAWGYEMPDGDPSIKVTISRLRANIADSEFTITASRGEGYYIERK